MAQTSDNSHKDSRSVHPNTVCNSGELVATKESPKRWVNLFPNDHMGFSSYNPILVLLRAGSKSPALEPHESCDCSSLRKRAKRYPDSQARFHLSLPHPSTLVLGTPVVWKLGHKERPQVGVAQLIPASAPEK